MSKLAIRFLRWIAAISIVITLAGICLATYLEYRDDLGGIRDQVASVETFVPTLSTSVWRLDDSQIDIQLQGIVRLPAVLHAAVEVNGEITHQQPHNPALVGPPDASYPLIYQSAGVVHDLGALVVRADQRYATDRVPRRFLEISAIQGVRGLLIAGVILWVFSHLVGRRLKALSGDISALDWSSLQSRSIPPDGNRDELSEVRHTLETMRVKIVEGMEREEQVQAELEMRRLFDPVTGLPNRILLTDRLETLRRSPANLPLAVVAVELLRLSEIDLLLDSAAMHQTMNEVAEALNKTSGAGGLVSRYSERRFVLVAGPMSEHHQVEALTAGIAAVFEHPFLGSQQREIYLSASIGVASSADDEDIDAGRLLSRAMVALDAAVAQGDGTRIYWGEHLRHQGVASIYQELRSALSQQAFDLHCQPILDLTTGTVESIECLIRWHSERLMTYGIQGSIHLLEQSGLSELLDRSVLTAALALRARLRPVYAGPIAINLTARSLSNPAYAEFLAEQDPDLLVDLELELTETNVLHDVRTAQRLAEGCRERGVRLVLDDFGTGFSSIEYLSQFQFHAIKIDRSFLRAGLNNQRRLLRSMVSIAHGVGSRVVAEGIEAEWQRILVRELKVECGQGYMLSYPLPEADLMTFLQAAEVAS